MATTSLSIVSKRDFCASGILTGIVTMILPSAAAKLSGAPRMVEGLVRAGIPRTAIPPIAVLELVCLAFYLAPRTAMLGTLLLTGYFGGSTLAHLIGGDSLAPPLAIGLMIWGGAWSRIPALQQVLPLRGGRL